MNYCLSTKSPLVQFRSFLLRLNFFYRLFIDRGVPSLGYSVGLALLIFFLIHPPVIFASNHWQARTACEVVTNPSLLTKGSVGSKIGSKIQLEISSVEGSDSIKSIKSVIEELPDEMFPGELYLYYPYDMGDASACHSNALVTVNSRADAANIATSLQYTILWRPDCRGSFQEGDRNVGLWYYHKKNLISYDTVLVCKGDYVIRKVPPRCDVVPTFSGIGDVSDDTWKVVVSNIAETTGMDDNVYVSIDGTALDGQERTDGPMEFPIPAALRTPGPHTATAHLYFPFVSIIRNIQCGSGEFTMEEPGKTHICKDPKRDILLPNGTTRKDCKGDYAQCSDCPKSSTSPLSLEGAALCDQLPENNNFLANCWSCVNRAEIERQEAEAKGEEWKQTSYVWTAIGCVPTDFTTIINEYVFVYGFGIAGGLAFLRFLYGCFLIMTSSGNAETVEESQAIITSALAGLLLIIFSVFFLRLVGVDIFEIPEWSSARSSTSTSTPPAAGSCTDPAATRCTDLSCCAGDAACQYQVTGQGWGCKPFTCTNPSKPYRCSNDAAVCCGSQASCKITSTGSWSCDAFVRCPGKKDCGEDLTSRTPICCPLNYSCPVNRNGGCVAPTPTRTPTATPTRTPTPPAVPASVPLPADNSLGWVITVPGGPYAKGQEITVGMQHNGGAGFYHALLSADPAGTIKDCKAVSVIQTGESIRLPDVPGPSTLHLLASRLPCYALLAKGNMSQISTAEATRQAYAEATISP